jgi:4-amino-4-deoxy-L-arabinose transferase-like glycosyltransferase
MSWREKSCFPLWLGFGLFTFLLRLPFLTGSFWLDEAAQAVESTRPWAEQFDLADDFQPPLFHLWVFLLQQVSHSEAWMRLASVLPGVLTTVLFTAVAERWFSRKAALWVGLLLSTSSLMVFFSQELRPYMFAVGWSSLASFAFLELMFAREDNGAKKSSWWLLVFTIANAAAILSSYVALFLLPAWLITTFLIRRESTALILKSLGVSGLFFGVWFLGFREQLAVGNDLRSTLPGWDQVVSLPQAKAFFLTLGKFVSGRLPLDLSVRHTVLVGIPLALLLAGGSLSGWKNRSSVFMAAALIFCLPLMLTWIFSFFIPVLEPKRVLYLLPWLFLLVGVVSTRWRWSWIVGAVWLGIQVFGLLRYWQDPLLQREPWREAVQLVEQNYQSENSVVVFGFDGPFAPWRWYQQEGFPTINTGRDPLDTQEEALDALEGVERYENVVLFDYLRDLTDPHREIEQILVQKGFREIAVWDFPNIGFVRLFYREQLFAQR